MYLEIEHFCAIMFKLNATFMSFKWVIYLPKQEYKKKKGKFITASLFLQQNNRRIKYIQDATFCGVLSRKSATGITVVMFRMKLSNES